MPKERQKLKDVLAALNKKHGAGTVMLVGEDDERTTVDWATSNCYSLDRVMGQGIPKGRIIDIYGQPSGGKSTIAMYLVAQIQKAGGTAAWVDAEFSFTSEYAQKIGVDVGKLIYSQPRTGEEAIDIVVQLVDSGELDIIVVDSTAALVPAKELEGDVTESNVALQARLLSKGLRMITGATSKSKTVVMFISQVRDKIGGFGGFNGPSTDATGGKALKFYSSIRLEVTKKATLKDGEEVVGNKLKVSATKNKVAAPFKVAEIDLYFAKGIDTIGDIMDVSVDKGIVSKSGASYSFGELKLGYGREVARKFLEENPDTFKAIREALLKL